MVESARKSGAPFQLDPARDLVMGHEFAAEILDYGEGSTKPYPTGTRLQASVRTSTVPEAGAGSGTSSTTMRVPRRTTAFIRPISHADAGSANQLVSTELPFLLNFRGVRPQVSHNRRLGSTRLSPASRTAPSPRRPAPSSRGPGAKPFTLLPVL